MPNSSRDYTDEAVAIRRVEAVVDDWQPALVAGL
jgi:hypothetical protein